MAKMTAQAILEQVNIVDILGRFLTLTRHGNSYRALCPFHDDRNPSLMISPDKQIFKCFVCGTGGNAFTFVQQYEKINFPQAVRRVAEIAGIQVEGWSGTTISPEVLRYYQVNELAYKYFNYNILNLAPDSELARYLADRHLDPEIIEQFKIGYAPNDDGLVKYLLNQGVTPGEILVLGLGYDHQGELRSRFRNRLMFAITDNRQIKGFSGRRIGDNDEAKYVNSSESLVFHKNTLLYHYDEGAAASLSKRCIYIVEGFMDVIALTRAGYANCVATMGTAFTKEHAHRLQTQNIILAYDSDQAGMIATFKTLTNFPELKCQVVDYTSNRDPDEILWNEGADALQATLERQITPLNFFFKYFQDDLLGKTSFEKRSSAFDFLISQLVPLSGLPELEGIKRLAIATGYSTNDIKDQIARRRGKPAVRETRANQRQAYWRTTTEMPISPIPARAISPDEKVSAISRQILKSMMTDEEWRAHACDVFFDAPVHRTIASYIYTYYESEAKRVANEALMLALAQEDEEAGDEVIKEISFIFSEDFNPIVYSQEVVTYYNLLRQLHLELKKLESESAPASQIMAIRRRIKQLSRNERHHN